MIFIGHLNSVTSLEVADDFLFSGDYTGLILQWLVSSGSLIREFKSKFLLSLHFKGTRIMYLIC
jgi:hypothetical protein